MKFDLEMKQLNSETGEIAAVLQTASKTFSDGMSSHVYKWI